MNSNKLSLKTTGIPTQAELEASPGYPRADQLEKGPLVVIECIQDIPCNPCELVCPNGAIFIGDPITNLPIFDAGKCDACGLCIPICPGQAIFRVDLSSKADRALVAFPYEFLPLPQKGDVVEGVDRTGDVICSARVTRVQTPKAFDHTAVITIEVPRELAMEVRSIKRLSRTS